MIDNNVIKLSNFLPNFEIDWTIDEQTGSLPAFKMVKAKHNNKTKTNVKGSNITSFVSKGRELPKIFTYTGYVKNTLESLKIRDIFRLYGIEPQCGSEIIYHINPDVERFFVRVSFKQANKLISIVEKNKEKMMNFSYD